MIRSLFIDLDKKEFKNEIIDNRTLDYSIILNKDIYRTYERDPYNNNLTILSAGYIKDENDITSLLIYRSPITNSLDINISSFGKYIRNTGNDMIILKGRLDKKYFIIIENDNVIFLEDDIEEDIYNKKEKLYGELKNIYGNEDFILLLNGLGSKYTIYGNLIIFKDDKIKATKGGIGSVLYNYHNISGISIGGNNHVKINEIKINEKNMNFHENINDVYNLIYEKVPILNFKNIYLAKEENKKIFEDFIYPLINNLKKKYPYEPFNMFGPFLGIFDENYISLLIDKANRYGLDTLYLGFILGLILEGLAMNKVNINGLNSSIFDFNNLDRSTENNYKIVDYLMDKIAYEELSILGKNIRYISNIFNLDDISVYAPLGESYSAVFNPYISLGLFLPNIIYDKYFSDHLMNPTDPVSYAELNYGRLESTFYINNLHDNIYNFKRDNVFVKMLEYQKLTNSMPNFNYSKRLNDIYLYISRNYNLNYTFEDYFLNYYNRYKELIYNNKASVV
ncbi:glyceraldehyde-3-phosphate dehydrogenase [Nanobdella aerobiophila]|uniref:Glyceraldehyde-3-phosphate dehydrogenase n=1 Tax=Nanobdella aerobiophila TaxID=2586965 RepID=A0A915WRV4_9ARCH|nr:aldehyde ferredoxin oxidoreductase N-terminal domain-containing protein [Nanobdella aerobiophila]BBL45639.1 glyceraldehyde-3-phosphate dehydrogenase [Nanobdella aerobiophila]